VAVEQVGASGFTQQLERDVEAYVAELGLRGSVRVELRLDGERAVIVRAAGSTLAYPPSFLARLWFGIAPAELRGAPDGYASVRGFPDGWLVECSRSVVESRDAAG
jgi:hypothetical protein